MNTGPFRVFLAGRDWANPGCAYAFPTWEAACRFATLTAVRSPAGRKVMVREMGGVRAWTPDVKKIQPTK
jgi:hypothetical protein